ncbi:Hypothetical predicted protein [Mytilus galloprovincialis]|uniref:Integrase catalytic domain-containing protein n=1 Tax=Mytilus galloprovincialis TaxID=29158 RepID=A0A8B6GG89_MYTGA|nr:Hypothetical predicted protein [Mytilus galloprovincialis]
MEAFPLPDQQAEQVAEKLVHEFISRFGTPLEIHTDQGRNFESIIFKEICKLFEIKKTRSTSYRPCSNGVIEKFNATLEKMIQNFVNKNVNDWDVYIGILMSAYRSMIHPATGFTPNMMMLGREVILPNHIIFPLKISLEQSMFTNNNYVEKLQSQFEEIYHLARENLRASPQRKKKDYDTRVSQNQCKPTTVPVLLDVNEDYTVYNEVVVQTTATQTDDKYEDHENLKKQHNKEMNILAVYISKIRKEAVNKRPGNYAVKKAIEE